MPSFHEAKQIIEEAVQNKDLLILIGECSVEYSGRAISKLEKGRRMLVLKGDSSFAIHQNKLLRPVNYMLSTNISCLISNGALEITALKKKPKESLKVLLFEIDFVKLFHVHDQEDLRLVGSESELSSLLAQDLSFIEPGLKPSKQEQGTHKGTIDILAEDSKGRVVVIEVKRRKATLDAVSQLHRYTEDMKKLKNRETRGILLAPDITDSALNLLHHYSLEYFKLDFSLAAKSAQINGLERSQRKLTDCV